MKNIKNNILSLTKARKGAVAGKNGVLLLPSLPKALPSLLKGMRLQTIALRNDFEPLRRQTKPSKSCREPSRRQSKPLKSYYEASRSDLKCSNSLFMPSESCCEGRRFLFVISTLSLIN